MSNIDRKAAAQRLERTAKQHRDSVISNAKRLAQSTSHFAKLGFTYVRVLTTGK